MSTDEAKNADVVQGGVEPKKRGRPAKEDTKVEVSATTLESMVKRLEALETEAKKKDEQISVLTEAADKGRLARIQQQKGGPLVRMANISIWEGKPVIGWKTTKDDVGFRNGFLYATQEISVWCLGEDGKPEEKPVENIGLLNFNQNATREEGEVIRTTLQDGKEFLTLKMSDGREITIDTVFINR